MDTATKLQAGITLWLVEGGVDIKDIPQDGSATRRIHVPVDKCEDFLWNEEKSYARMTEYFGQDVFEFQNGVDGKMLRLFPRPKGHYFGGWNQGENKASWSVEEFKAAAKAAKAKA
jgi:hypothetical protein